ncbi:MAG: helix-turn-helix domain-containing protein, partial [Oscillospiraceae bacterium]
MSYFGSIYADQDLSHRARAVYMYLKDRSNTGDTCWPSVRRISAQQTIPYVRMLPDGICQLPGGVYTKTLEYEDIN